MFGPRPERPPVASCSDGRGQVGGCDVGVAQVMEAVVIGVVVLSATFFAVSFQTPPSPEQNPGTEQTEAAAQSALASLDELYIDDERYNHSALSRALAKAAAGDEKPLVDSVGAFLPAEASFCLYLNNGESRRDLHCPSEPPGSAVGVSYPIEPNWRFHYTETDLRYYDEGADTQLGLTEIPILNAHSVRDQGHYVDVTIEGSQNWKPGRSVQSPQASLEETAYTTMLQGDEDANYPSAAIYMTCEDGDPCYATDFERRMTGYGPHGSGNAGEIVRFTVDNDGPGVVTDGSTLEIRFPAGLDLHRGNIDASAGFTNVRVSGFDDATPETVQAELDGDLGSADGDEIHLDVEVNVTDTRYAYRQVDANLEGGAVSSSQLLFRVKDKPSGTWTGGDTRVTMLSTPKPAGSLDTSNPTGRWGVVLPIPYGQTRLDKLTFELEDGENVLRSVSWPSDFTPPTDIKKQPPEKKGASKFVWEKAGGETYQAYTFAEFQFEVETNGTQTPASERFPFAQPEATFEGYDPPPQSVQVEPGIWWREYPSAEAEDCHESCPGYRNSFSLDSDNPVEDGPIWATMDWRGVSLEGDTIYKIADISNESRKGQKDAVQATELGVSPRRVAPGEHVWLDIDTEDLAHYIADTSGATDMRLKSNIYAPWGIPNRIPVKTIDHGRLAGNIEAPTDLLPLYLDGDNVEDVLVASTDGNVYGIHGNSGENIAGAVFGIPEGSGSGSAIPNHLDRGTEDTGEDVIAVGTREGADNFYVIDGDMEERWNSTKPEGNRVHGIAVGDDLDGSQDGVPEIVLGTKADTAPGGDDGNWSRLTLWNGDNGEVTDGFSWNFPDDYGIVIPGKANQVGTGDIGVRANEGVWSTTGQRIGTNAAWVVEKEVQDFAEGDDDLTGDPRGWWDRTITIEGSEPGIVGFLKNGGEAFNLSGARPVDAQRADQVTPGDENTGLTIGGADGWLWGLNTSQPMMSISGWTTPGGVEPVTGLAMANQLEGYKVSADGLLWYTEDAWTTLRAYGADDLQGVATVDTPDGPFRGENSSVAWWGGWHGKILQSTDRLNTLDAKTATASYVASVDVDSGEINPSFGSLQTFDLTRVNITDTLAINEDQAWFVGKGHDNVNGYIINTNDGGASFQVAEVDCGSLLDSASCGLEAIDHDGEHLWVAGHNGLVMTKNATGAAADTVVDGNATITDDGRIDIPLASDDEVTIDNATVIWDPMLKLTYGKAVHLADRGSEDEELWETEDGCRSTLSSYTEDGTCSAEWGYDHGNTLQIKRYLSDHGKLTNRTLQGESNLTVGPFTSDTLDGYHDRSFYENESNLPLTFVVNVTFTDGTSDAYTVHINDTGHIGTAESSPANWTYPSNLEGEEPFATPPCFGTPDSDCSDHHGINVTDVSEDDEQARFAGVVAGPSKDSSADALGTALYQLGEGTRTWAPVEAPLEVTYHDASINTHDASELIASGTNGRTIVSYDGGANWTLVPTNPVFTITQPIYATDWTHPDTAFLEGGGAEGYLRNVYGGYPQNGQETTTDIYPNATPLEKIELTDPPIADRSDNGDTNVHIEVKDPATGEWNHLYATDTSGPYRHDFETATTDIELRFTLHSNATKRYSATVRGDMAFAGLGSDSGDFDDPDETFTFDINETSKFATEFDELQHLEMNEQGMLRLPAFNNPWVNFLGNDEEGPWSDVKNRGDVGARVADLELAPNGSTIWVMTEGIYKQYQDPDLSPISDTDCTTVNPPTTECWDNTLYAIDAETGQREEWWDPMRFTNVPQKIAVGEDSVSVVTGNATQHVRLYWMEIDDPGKDNMTMLADQSKVANELVEAEAFPNHTAGQDDPIIGTRDVSQADDQLGKILGFRAPDMYNWMAMPALNEQLSLFYEVPEEALYGNWIVVTEVLWNLTETEYQESPELVQSARLHNTFEVTPNGGEMPLVPTYTLEVVAWIDDWR